jgi:hypothetical protein
MKTDLLEFLEFCEKKKAKHAKHMNSTSTPLTDAFANVLLFEINTWPRFARDLERRLAEVTEERDILKKVALTDPLLAITFGDLTSKLAKAKDWDSLSQFQIKNLQSIVSEQEEDIASVLAKLDKCRKALEDLLYRYVTLVESGDAGNWNPEIETQVIAAREALK